jgi:hypothetical protein
MAMSWSVATGRAMDESEEKSRGFTSEREGCITCGDANYETTMRDALSYDLGGFSPLEDRQTDALASRWTLPRVRELAETPKIGSIPKLLRTLGSFA